MVESKFYKSSNNNSNKNNNGIKKYLLKILVTVVITLLILIGFKCSSDFKSLFNKYVYNNTFPFTKVKELYSKYFKGDFPLKGLDTTEVVFNEVLTYSKKSLYEDGVALTVNKNYMVPSLESGIVVFIGNKDSYNNTVIIQGMNGIDYWYSNISLNSVKLYDYVEKGALVGEVADSTLYLAFQKEGKFVSYQDYFK